MTRAIDRVEQQFTQAGPITGREIPVVSRYHLDTALRILSPEISTSFHSADYAIYSEFLKERVSNFMYKKLGWGPKGDFYRRIFGSQATEEDGLQFWDNLSYRILQESERRNLHWDGEEVVIPENDFCDLVRNTLPQSDQDIDDRLDACWDTMLLHEWPIERNEDSNFVFAIPEGIFFHTAQHMLRQGYSGIIDRLEENNFLKRDGTVKYPPLLYTIAEHILLHQPQVLEEYINSLMAKFDERMGLAIAAKLIETLHTSYFFTWRGKQEPKGTPYQLEILKKIRKTLKEQYLRYSYTHRPEVVDEDSREYALKRRREEGPAGFLEALFIGTGAMDNLWAMLEDARNIPIDPILLSAKDKRKVEGGIILPIADCLGYSHRRAALIAALTHIAYTAVMTADDALDDHEHRDERVPVHRKIGKTSTVERSFQALFKVANRLSRNKLFQLEQAYTSMIAAVYEGDSEAADLCWDEEGQRYMWDVADFEKKYEEALRKISRILRWFPIYAGKAVGLKRAGEAFGRLTENIGVTLFLINDIEDILKESEKHEAGKDIGNKLSWFWYAFGHLQLSTDDQHYQDLETDQARVREIFDVLGVKRRSGEKLDEIDQVRLQEAINIGRKYLPNVIKALWPKITELISNAGDAIQEVYTILPRDKQGRLDERNEFYRGFFASYITELQAKLRNFGHPEPVVAVA